MALVDYSSSSDSGSDERDPTDPGPALKKRRLSATRSATPATAPPPPDLPPLPSTFHDLYASTVRLSNTDDPSLHQGRKRQVPHIAGHWPSHLYIEWHPLGSEHALLTSLVSTLSARLLEDKKVKIQGFLTSELGAALPLHISLSRPLSLTTGQKDGFLSQLRETLARTTQQRVFELTPTALEWHRTHESARSFLVLRVVSAVQGLEKERKGAKNRELSSLLRLCNAHCRTFSQPELYTFKGERGALSDVEDAFHVSIAWSFEEPTEDVRRVTQEVFMSDGLVAGIKDIRIRVDGVKAKIGNVVTNLPLSASRSGKEHKEHENKGFFGY